MMIEAAREHGLADDPILRQRLAEYHSKIQIIRINGLRSLTQSVTGKKDPGVAVLGATNKLWWSEMHKAAMELAVDIYGPEAMLRTTGPEPWPATQDRQSVVYGTSGSVREDVGGRRIIKIKKDTER